MARRGKVEVSRFINRAAKDCLAGAGAVEALAALLFVVVVVVAVVAVAVVVAVKAVVTAVGFALSCAAFGSKDISE